MKLRLIRFFLIFWVLGLKQITAQVTLKVVSWPANTPPNATIYFASSINNWNPGSSSFTLVNNGQGAYEITIPEGSGSVQYKFTRGSWATVEGNATGGEIGNRSFSFSGQPQTIELNILTWKDLEGGSGGSSATGNVQILDDDFFMPQLNRTRRIWLYLPPDYETTNKHYPVIYMHDGQNLFDNQTSFSGEWEVDETLNELHAEGDYGAIVVGIDNGGAQRINEYGPWVNPQYGGGQGADYMDFIVETLKPYIDANFRTLSQAKYTAMIGSSLGALISTYGQVKFAHVFSKVGSFSPAYWFNLAELNGFIQNGNANLSASRYYFVAGQNESATMVANINTIRNALQNKGLTASNTLVKIDSDGTHTEAYWRREFGAAYEWLFANETLGEVNLESQNFRIYQVGANTVYAEGLTGKLTFELIDSTGRFISFMEIQDGTNTLEEQLPTGVYYLRNEHLNLRIFKHS